MKTHQADLSKNPKNQPTEHSEDRGGRWLLNGVVWLVSALIIAGSIPQGNWQGIGLGGVLAFWRVMATPEITNYFALKINWKGRKQTIKLQHSPGAQTVAVQGDNPQVTIEQNSSQTAQQLAELIYTPLLKQANSWLRPVPTYTTEGWANLETEKPFLVRLVPKDIAEIFNRAMILQGRISVLALPMTSIFDKAMDAAKAELSLTQASNQCIFRIRFGTGTLELMWLGTLWASGKTLTQYATDFIAEKYPDSDWHLDLVIDNAVVGDQKAALVFDEVAQTHLSQDSTAIEMRKKYAELKKLGVKAQKRIDDELDKLVRLKA